MLLHSEQWVAVSGRRHPNTLPTWFILVLGSFCPYVLWVELFHNMSCWSACLEGKEPFRKFILFRVSPVMGVSFQSASEGKFSLPGLHQNEAEALRLDLTCARTRLSRTNPFSELRSECQTTVFTSKPPVLWKCLSRVPLCCARMGPGHTTNSWPPHDICHDICLPAPSLSSVSWSLLQ